MNCQNERPTLETLLQPTTFYLAKTTKFGVHQFLLKLANFEIKNIRFGGKFLTCDTLITDLLKKNKQWC